MNGVQPIYKGRIVDLRLEETTLPNGMRVSLEMIRHPGAAAVVALDPDNRVSLIHQFRHAAAGYLWELPAGKLDPGEAPEVCAGRELREETGLVAAQIIRLGSILTAPGFCDERIHLFLARELRQESQALEADEVLSVHWVPFAEALEMIRDGRIDDAKTIAGLHLATSHVG